MMAATRRAPQPSRREPRSPPAGADPRQCRRAAALPSSSDTSCCFSSLRQLFHCEVTGELPALLCSQPPSTRYPPMSMQGFKRPRSLLLPWQGDGPPAPPQPGARLEGAGGSLRRATPQLGFLTGFEQTQENLAAVLGGRVTTAWAIRCAQGA